MSGRSILIKSELGVEKCISTQISFYVREIILPVQVSEIKGLREYTLFEICLFFQTDKHHSHNCFLHLKL
jgi:hypothetical protein